MVDNQKLPHLAVDDATGTVVGAFFDVQETLYGLLYGTKTNT